CPKSPDAHDWLRAANRAMCVCHWGSKSGASRRTTYEFGCRAESREVSRETIMKRRAPAISRESPASEIASPSKLHIDELRERWKAMFGKAPSRDISRSFLTRAIAYRLQEKAFGGLKPSTQRLLAEFASDGANGSALA